MHKLLSLAIVGTAPLVIHNGQTADPLNKYAKMLKEVSASEKRQRRTFSRWPASSSLPASTWIRMAP